MSAGRRLALSVIALAALVLAPKAAADDCDTLGELTDAFSAARTAVGDARAGAASGGGASADDVAALLATAKDAVAAARAGLGAATSPAGLVSRRAAMRSKLAAAAKSVARARRHPGRARHVRNHLGAARRAMAAAVTMLERVTGPAGCGATLNGAIPAGEVFPADNWWNADVSGRAPLANSDAIIDFIGRDKGFHADFGTTFGIPYVVLDAPQPLVQLTFGYDDESDHGAAGAPPGYPIPSAAKTTAGWIEGGVPGGGTSGDRHLLIVDRTTHTLFEIYTARWTGSKWTGGSGAIFDLTSNARRPEGWTSADAAGLAILPGLVRADEVLDLGEITHALRFTVRATKGYVYPASHDATHGSGGDLRPPLGLRVRMKAGVDLSGMSAPARVVFTAMKRYGLILADNGSDWYITGAPDPRWDDEQMHDDFATVTGDDFEAVE